MTCLDNILIANAHYSRTTLLIFSFLTGRSIWLVVNKFYGKEKVWLKPGRQDLVFEEDMSLSGSSVYWFYDLRQAAHLFTQKAGESPCPSYVRASPGTYPFSGL